MVILEEGNAIPVIFPSGYANRTDCECRERWAGKWADPECFSDFFSQQFIDCVRVGDGLLKVVACVIGIWYDRGGRR